MARKTVRISIPENIQQLTQAAATMLTRNDGAPPTLPTPNAAVQDIANRLGVTISINPTNPTTTAVPPGTSLIPTGLLAPLRTMYPQLARDVATLAIISEYTEALSTSVMNRLGIADGQTLENVNTVRAIFSRITPVLKSLLAGNENEIGTYGLAVTLGTTSTGSGTPPTPPTP